MRILAGALGLSYLLSAHAAWGEAAIPRVEERPLARAPRSARQLTVQLGFGHWFGKNFGAPIGATTPALTIGLRPRLHWLELRAYYSVTTDSAGLADDGRDERRRVRSLRRRAVSRAPGRPPAHGHGLRAQRRLRSHRQGIGISLGSDIFARYLIDVSGLLAIGPFVDVRAMYYELPGSGVPDRRGGWPGQAGAQRHAHPDRRGRQLLVTPGIMLSWGARGSPG